MTDLVTDYFNPKCEKFIIHYRNNKARHLYERRKLKEEVLNLFYKHSKKEYHDTLIEYMLSGECCVILMCHETENPISKWKEIIGNKNPEEAKKSNPESLRAIYGKSLIKNELHGSDNAEEANRERDIFKFTIPQKVPEFEFNKMKVSLDTLFKFIYPPNLEHPIVNERLDLFALYGPAVNYHSVDQCFCKPCSRIGKELLEIVRQNKIISEKKRLGIAIKNDANLKKFAASMSTRKGGSKADEKVKIAPIRLLKEEDIQQIYDQFCEKCKNHVDNYSHLCGGRDGQVILTDNEINELAREINKQEILELMTIEKGNAAKIIIETIQIREPDHLTYNKDIIRVLLQDLETDYYERYEFYDMQQMILEDRRIRMTAWMSHLINKPIERFKNPKLINLAITQQQRKDIKTVHFTLDRILPLSMTVQKENISHVPTDMPPSIIDKKKLQANEYSIALHQRLHRHTTHIVSIDDVKNGDSYKISVNLMRDGYNEGRHGSWNNYCSIKQKQKGSYVQTRNTTKTAEFG